MSEFSAARFNRLVRDVMADRPVAGRHCALEQTGHGTVIDGEALGGEPPHSWMLRPRYAAHPTRPGQFAWQATVDPGFVNGLDASIDGVSLLADPAPVLVFDVWRDVLRPSSLTSTDEGEIIATVGPPFPKVFEEMGVKRQARGGSLTQPDAITPPEDPARTRELRACDVVMVVPRAGSRQDVQILNPIANAQTIQITSSLVIDVLESTRFPFALQAVPAWAPPQEPSGLERLLGAPTPQTDELKIATLWMVSPPGAGIDSVPDGTWTPYPQHFVFYDLMHASETEVPNIPFAPIRLVTGLAGGVADTIFASLLQPVNDAFAVLNALLARSNFRGGFWNV